MSGSFSKQSSNQQSTSQGLQYGENAAQSFGVTGSDSQSSQLGGSQSAQTSGASQFGQSTSQQQIAFQDLFQQLYGGASVAAKGVNTAGLSDTANQLFSGGVSFLQQLQGNAGTDALAARVGDTSARDSQLGALQSSLGDFFNEQLLPGVVSRGVSSGTYGGSRDAVASSMAAKQVAGQYAQGAAQIIGTDQQQRDTAAAQLGGLQQQGALGGLSSLASLFGLASSGAQAGLSPFETLAQIFGGPTTLTQAQSVSGGQSAAQGYSSSFDIASAISKSFGQQGSQSYGFDFGSNTSQSTGSGKGFGISGGFLAPAAKS